MILEKAGKGSEHEKRFKVYLDLVTVCTYPDGYIEELIEMFPGQYQKIRVLALDAYDLALAKLERNSRAISRM